MATSLAITFVNPDTVLQQVGEITPGATVADFGCGSGYFSFAFARLVGQEGKVIALDILPSALEAVASRAKILGLRNVFTKRANLERENGSGLESESVDWTVLKDILFQNNNKEAIFKEVYRILRPQGKLLVMEWKEGDASVGPEEGLRLPPEALVEMAQRIGFHVYREVNAGDFHYAFVFEK